MTGHSLGAALACLFTGAVGRPFTEAAGAARDAARKTRLTALVDTRAGLGPTLDTLAIWPWEKTLGYLFALPPVGADGYSARFMTDFAVAPAPAAAAAGSPAPAAPAPVPDTVGSRMCLTVPVQGDKAPQTASTTQRPSSASLGARR